MKQGPEVIVFASLNAGKVREVGALLSGLPVRLVGPADVGVESLPEETGETFLDNALLKAAHVYRETGLWALSDDSGLEVMALGGAPGVHSARYGGREHDDAANIERLLRDLQGVGDRRARFVCHALLVAPVPDLASALRRGDVEGIVRVGDHPWMPPGAEAVVAVGEVWGWIACSPVGNNGFGYDPVFYRDDLGRTFAQLTSQEKNALSHRGQAFSRMRVFLERLFVGGA